MITEKVIDRKPVIRHEIKREYKKTIMLAFYFEVPLSVENASKGALLGKILSSSSQGYPDIKAISEKEQYLYGSYHYFDMDKYGDRLFFIYKMVFPNYTILGDDPALEEALSFYRGLLYKPNVEGKNFEEKNFFHEKKMLVQSLETLSKDPYGYAHRKLIQLLYENHPLGVYKYGDATTIEKISSNDLYEFYESLLKEAPFFSYAHGDVSDIKVVESTFDEVTPLVHDFGTYKEVHEKIQGSQSILVQAYELPASNDEEVHANLLLDRILGGHPGSILFKVLREEKQYCYSVYTKYDRYRGLLFLTIGFNEEHLEDLLKDLISIFTDLKEGLVTEEDLYLAKKDAKGALLSLYDSQSSFIEYTFLQEYFKRADSIDGRVEKIEKMGLEDINEAARKLKLLASIHLEGGSND